ncbi:hypothetical protein PRIPAC_93642 [Pristionchus pacificus]|uniref:Uncharacterized protein n=1 Tax=Pristionchus pacificus TaxID=54126 RepID=A0A454XK70_PRIPA|nr:hypothetical protein PRIPAC_93642 [Pristionchus pacificus]|eukprot:PDM76400.1 hypothetical protein PRIPAC_40004 [Pristionchus pacificus]
MSRSFGSSGGGNRRSAPSYQTSSSSARNYSSTGGSDRDYSRSHLPGNGSSSGGGANYNSAYSAGRKSESGSTSCGGYAYLEPNWIEKTRSSIPIDPYASSYLDRAPISTSRDYTTAAAAAAQPVYPSAAAAALSVGAYGASSSSMPKAYATRADDYYRAASATLAAPAAYGYSSAFEQSTMAAQAAAIYEMQMKLQNSSKRDAWQAAAASHHAADYGHSRREDDRRGGGGGGGMERRRDDGRRGDERRVDDRRGGAVATESWRDRDREVARDHRRPSLPTRERERDRDMRVPAAAAPARRDASHREVRRSDAAAPASSSSAARGRRDEHARDREGRDARDTSRRSIDKRAAVVDSRLDRESRELERQLAKVQRELEQLESSGGGRSKGKESDRPARRSAPSASVARRSAATAPARDARDARGGVKLAAEPPLRRTFPTRPQHRIGGAPPPMMRTSAYGVQRRTPAVRPMAVTSRFGGARSLGGRVVRPTAMQPLPSLMDALVPRPGRRVAPFARVSRASAWEALPRRSGAPLPPARYPAATRRVVGATTYAGKRPLAGGAVAMRTGGRGEVALSSREKVRRAKEKMRREEDRRKRNEKRRERAKETKESREKRKEEDFAWLETIMSEDEELDEETNRKLLLAPRQHRITALVDHAAVHPATAEQLEEKRGEEEAVPELWTAEECDAIELLPIIDPSLSAAVAAAFLDSHPAPKKEEEPAHDESNGKTEE